MSLQSYQYTVSTTAILVEGEGGVMMTPRDSIECSDQPRDVMRMDMPTPVKTNQLYFPQGE